MDQALKSFRKREQAVRRKHIRMSQGYITRIGRNGVIEQVPDRKLGANGLGLLLRLAVVLTAFKVLVLTWLGETVYLETLDALSRGLTHEKAGAWLMQIDPLTRKLVDLVAFISG